MLAEIKAAADEEEKEREKRNDRLCYLVFVDKLKEGVPQKAPFVGK